MKLLYLLTTDETLARLFILGVEGHNYTVDEKGIARYPEGIDATNQTWMSNVPWFYPNQCLSIPLETEMTTYYTDMLDAPNHAKFSEAMALSLTARRYMTRWRHVRLLWRSTEGLCCTVLWMWTLILKNSMKS